MAHIPEPEQEPASEFTGIPVTAEGKARARRLLEEAAARRDPESLAAMRALVGLRQSPGATVQRYPQAMEQDANPQSDTPWPVGAGTPEGLARARRLLDESRDGMTDQDWADLRAKFGYRERRIA